MQGDSTHVRISERGLARPHPARIRWLTYHDHRELTLNNVVKFISVARILLGILYIGYGFHMETVFEILGG